MRVDPVGPVSPSPTAPVPQLPTGSNSSSLPQVFKVPQLPNIFRFVFRAAVSYDRATAQPSSGNSHFPARVPSPTRLDPSPLRVLTQGNRNSEAYGVFCTGHAIGIITVSPPHPSHRNHVDAQCVEEHA